MKQLSDKQLRFIELYAGNATEAAQKAGYSHAENAGMRCMKNAQICTAIAEKRSKEVVEGIADRQQLQKLWTDVAFDKEETMRERLKSSELLGKSLGVFLDKTEHSGSVNFNVPPAITVIFTDEK